MNGASAARFASVRDAIHRRCFAPARVPSHDVGAEIELLALDSASNRPIPLIGGRRSLIALLRQRASSLGWREVAAYGPVPRFEIPGHAVVSFEPGGQLEISTAVHRSVTALTAQLRAIVPPLVASLAADGVRLVAVGIDPVNDARTIPQQLPTSRYERMTEYFDSRGPFGVRMMRQTAAIQVSLERGAEPASRWRLLNDLAPYVTAIFANSPRYLGVETGHVSYRAHCWRMLDPLRTGVAARDADPATAYARFALDAPDMLRQDADGAYHAFGAWPEDDTRAARWETHLTTLFPEVRPRGHFEVRSCDAIDPVLYAAPVLFLYGLAYDRHAAHEAAILAADSSSMLRPAGHRGLNDASIARTARDLFQLALAGARRLGDGFVGALDIEVAEHYYAKYTARDRSPADDSQRWDPTATVGMARELMPAPPA
ncbi:MAG TPA: glutamate-cysteine ligase family protein [Gemmatimonadaceae bacterium]